MGTTALLLLLFSIDIELKEEKELDGGRRWWKLGRPAAQKNREKRREENNRFILNVTRAEGAARLAEGRKIADPSIPPSPPPPCVGEKSSR